MKHKSETSEHTVRFSRDSGGIQPLGMSDPFLCVWPLPPLPLCTVQVKPHNLTLKKWLLTILRIPFWTLIFFLPSSVWLLGGNSMPCLQPALISYHPRQARLLQLPSLLGITFGQSPLPPGVPPTSMKFQAGTVRWQRMENRLRDSVAGSLELKHRGYWIPYCRMLILGKGEVGVPKLRPICNFFSVASTN